MASAGQGNTLRIKRAQVKQEEGREQQQDGTDGMENSNPAAPRVKLEAGVDGATAAAAAMAAGMQPPRQRPTFSLSSTTAAAGAASSSSIAAAAAASSSPAVPASASASRGGAASAAPAVLTSSSLGARLARRPRSILDYLVTLDQSSLDALYTDVFTCLTIFRSLHPLAKQYLLRWLFVQAPLRLSIVNSWVMATTTSQQAHAHAMRTLWELHLLTKEDPHRAAAAAAAAASGVKPEPAADSKSTAADSDPLVWFHPSFQRSLQDALSNHVDSAEGSVSDSSAAATDPHRPSIEQLEAYASDRWDDILHWMVGATRPSATGGGIPPREVTSRLVSMGLMEDPSAPSSTAAAGGLGLLTADGGGGGGGRPRMSPSGFTFLLKDVATQAWDVVLGYIDTGTSNAAAAASASGAGALGNAQVARDQMLHFLFRLSFLKLGMGYPTASLTPIQRQLLLDLTAFGLVYMHSPSAAVYYPTRLALNLSSTSGGAPQGSAPSATAAASAAATAGASSAAAAATIAESRAVTASSAASSQGFLLLETTFRLYAFTSSSFHAALLSLFTRLDVRLPNLLVGTLTKESVRRALKAHINAADIIAYLEAYARADQRALTPVLPENVTDQLRLWEAERNRMAMQDAFLFEFDSNVDSPQVIRLVTEEAFRHPHTLLLHHPAKKIIVVTPEGYAILKAFKLRLNEQMAQAAAAASKQV